MMSHRRLLSCLALACSFAVPAIALPPARAFAKAPAPADAPADTAADAPAAAPADSPADAPADAPAETPAAAAPGDAPANATGTEAPATADPLHDAIENFWHYGKIARYDLAVAQGQQILTLGAGKERDVVKNFEAVATERKDSLDQWLVRWQGVPAMADVTTKIGLLLNKGYAAQVGDPAFIQEQIERLSVNQRAYRNAIVLLRQAGEQAVPMMVRYLQDPSKQEHHAAIRQALGPDGLGRLALNPLLAATQMKDPSTLASLVMILGDIGYDVATPYLLKIAQDETSSPALKATVVRALARLDANRNQSAADSFYALAQRFYYDQVNVIADSRAPIAFAWEWREGTGLVSARVPPQILNEIMAMRCADESLRNQPPTNNDAVSLWLAAYNKREAELPAGATDPIKPKFPAHYYNVTTGVKYLDAVLTRALKDRNPAVALKAIRSMQEIVGRDNLYNGEASGTLVSAMRSADRQVRFESAMALAAGLPQRNFDGAQRVVPLLAEAVAQTGTPSVLIVASSQDEQNKLAKELSAYTTAGGVGSSAAIAAAVKLPAVDLILIGRGVTDDEIVRVIGAADQTARLERSARVIMRTSSAGRWSRVAVEQPLLTVSTATDGAGLATDFTAALTHTNTLGLNDTAATDYSLRAARLLERLAVGKTLGHGGDAGPLDVAAAEPTLLAALNDKREPVAIAAGMVLGLMNVSEIQPSLMNRAADSKTAPAVQVGLFKALSQNAKFFGNHLTEDQVNALRTALANTGGDDIRAAAAEALGALNLPVTGASLQILKASDSTEPANPAAAPPAPADTAPPAPAEGAEPAAPATPKAPAKKGAPKADAPDAAAPDAAAADPAAEPAPAGGDTMEKGGGDAGGDTPAPAPAKAKPAPKASKKK